MAHPRQRGLCSTRSRTRVHGSLRGFVFVALALCGLAALPGCVGGPHPLPPEPGFGVAPSQDAGVLVQDPTPGAGSGAIEGSAGCDAPRAPIDAGAATDAGVVPADADCCDAAVAQDGGCSQMSDDDAGAALR